MDSDPPWLRRLATSAQESLGVWLVVLVGLLASLIGFALLQQQLVSHEEAELGWVVHNRTRALEHGISTPSSPSLTLAPAPGADR